VFDMCGRSVRHAGFLPALRRDVELHAEFTPHLAGFPAVLDGFGGGLAPETEQHVVDE